jgi:hypothetical protein
MIRLLGHPVPSSSLLKRTLAGTDDVAAGNRAPLKYDITHEVDVIVRLTLNHHQFDDSGALLVHVCVYAIIMFCCSGIVDI